jgi:D-cysteine desulfhydrase
MGVKIHFAEPSRVELARLPTPVVALPNLSRAAGLSAVLLMKRDDLTGLEVSGNKVRKLEYVVADALREGADTLVTYGGYQSNHCRATAAVAARSGLKCQLILRGPADDADPANEGNLLLDRLLGAAVSIHPALDFSAKRQALVDGAMESVRRAGGKPYFFPVGASVPLGCWGYVRCVHELIEELGRNTKIDVFCAVGSSGTLAGLILGRALLRPNDVRVVGVPICDSVEFFQEDERRLIGETVARFELGLTEEETPIDLVGGFIGEGYAIAEPRSMEMLGLVARSEGILLDPTYTAKAMLGTVETIKGGGIRAGATAVFVHTGGVFGLLARGELFS